MVFDSSDISRFHFLEGCVGHFHSFLQFHFTATAGLRNRCASLSGNTLEGVEGFRKTCAEGWIRLGALGEMPVLNFLRGATEGPGSILKEPLLFSLIRFFIDTVPGASLRSSPDVSSALPW